MLINDSSNKTRREFFSLVDEDNTRIKQALEAELLHAQLIGTSNDITNENARMGQAFMPLEFENKLRKINPNIVIQFHPTKNNIKVVYFVKNNKKEYITAFENAPIPEFCVFSLKGSWEVDPSSLDSNFHISGKENLKMSLDSEGNEYWDPKLSRPGYKYIQRPWNILKMGWRTILLRLLAAGAFTGHEINNTFFPANNLEWAAKMGNQKLQARF